MKISARKADRIIAVSNSTKEDIQEIFDVDENKIKVIHNGISDHFRQIKNKELVREFKKEKGLPEDYILSLGNLKQHKNLPRLIDAVEEIQGKLKDFALVITGKGDVKSKLEEKVSEMGLSDKIKFTGYVDNSELPLLYNGARLFVYPSLNEGFGFPPLEAMACGTPTVASDVSSIPEVTGGAALLVDPYDPKAMAEGIERMWNDPNLRDEYITKGLERATLFSWKSCAKETLSVYEEVLKDGK